MAKPPVVSLCCQVGRQVLDKFGPGVSQSQTGGLVEAVVVRLALGISGERERGGGGAPSAYFLSFLLFVGAILLYEKVLAGSLGHPPTAMTLKSL